MTWAPDYTSRQRLKDYLNLEHDDADAFVDAWITAVSRNIDLHCGRQFGIVDAPEERVYENGRWDRRSGAYLFDIDDVFDVSGLTVETSAGTAVTDYTLLPRNAAQEGRPFTQLRTTATGCEVAMLGPWGWPTVPESVEVGTWLQAARLDARRDSPFGISGSPSEQGEIRLLAQLDPDFRTTLRPVVRKWWAR